MLWVHLYSHSLWYFCNISVLLPHLSPVKAADRQYGDWEMQKQGNMETGKYGNKEIWKQGNIETRKYWDKEILRQRNIESFCQRQANCAFSYYWIYFQTNFTHVDTMFCWWMTDCNPVLCEARWNVELWRGRRGRAACWQDHSSYTLRCLQNCERQQRKLPNIILKKSINYFFV